MPNTSKINHPYPEKNDREWFNKFENLVSSLDIADFSAREDRNLVVIGGGDVSVDSSFSLSWSEDILVLHPTSGVYASIPANPSGTQLSDGDILYIDLVRDPNSGYTASIQTTANAVSSNNRAFAVFFRKDSDVWMRDRGLISTGVASFASGEEVINEVPITLKVQEKDGTNLIGRKRLTIEDYLVENRSSYELQTEVEMQVTTNGQTGDLKVEDVANGVVLIDESTTSDQPQEFTATDTSLDASTSRIIEVSGGLDPAGAPYDDPDYLLVWHATLVFKSII